MAVLPNLPPEITATDPPELKTQYPHVDGITDWRAQQSIRLLWEQVFDHEARLQATEGTAATLVEAANDHQRQISLADHKADEALAGSQTTALEIKAGGGGGVGGGGGGGKDDLGLGAEGCSAAGATGHLTEPFDKTVTSAGKVVCGVGNEFPALLGPTPDYPTRLANREQLMERIVWHLNQNGFPASRYGTPGTAEHAFNLLFDALSLDGLLPMRQYAYTVTTYDPVEFGTTPPPGSWDTTNTYQTMMKCGGQSLGVNTPPEAGTPD
jgi:hypothetical protein